MNYDLTRFPAITGQDLRTLRTAKRGVTLKRVAERTGLSVSALSDYERQKRRVALDAALWVVEAIRQLNEHDAKEKESKP